MNNETEIKVIYLNNWLSGSWEVQKIHAQEFITAFEKQKKVRIFTYPKNQRIDLNNKSINQTINRFGTCKINLKKCIAKFPKTKIDKLLRNKKLEDIKNEINQIKPHVILIRHNIFYFKIIEKILKFGIPIVLEVNGLVHNDSDEINQKNREEIIKYEKNIFSKVSAICCVSHNIAKSIKGMGIDSTKISVVPNGANPSKFFPHEKSQKLCKKYDLDGQIVVGYVGGFDNSKSEGRDVITMLKAFEISKKITKHPVKLFMVGRIDEKFLRRIIKNLEINNSVVFTGFIEHYKLPKIMNLIDIAVAPYFEKRLKNASPMKLFEYMAMEKAVIIPKVGQVIKIVKNMESAVFVETENILSLSDALSMLIKNSDLRKKLGRNARILIKKKYTWEHNAMRIATVCRNVIERHLQQQNL